MRAREEIKLWCAEIQYQGDHAYDHKRQTLITGVYAYLDEVPEDRIRDDLAKSDH